MPTAIMRLIRAPIVVIALIILTACGGAGAPVPAAEPADTQRQNEQSQATEGDAIQPGLGASEEEAALEAGAPPPEATEGAAAAVEEEVALEAGAPPPETDANIEPPQVEVNPYTLASEDNLSTFALDVDTASYSAARNYLNDGALPPPDAVRVEEFVNYFDYDYSQPVESDFGIYVDAVASPLHAPDTQIVRVGIQGREIDAGDRKDAMLTFVIDVSGSMAEPNRLPLVKESLRLLVEELRPTDQVAVVVYGDTARTVLEPTSGSERETIMRAIEGLQNEGSTNAEAGLRMGYQLASDHFGVGQINRVILCSDGVANVGATDPDAIRQSIRDYAAQGVLLTTVGFGMGDYNDYLMEQLADDGNGNYAYVDDIDEAQRIFVENLTGMLQVIAKDAKVQVEFNPDVVAQYRLLGYENRAVADEDFRNDQVDAGEIGAGHNVTALYEVVLTGQGEGTALTVQMRYANPESGEVIELAQPLASADFGADMAEAAPHLKLAIAVAAFAEHLRGSGYVAERPLADVLAIAEEAATQLPNDADAQEFVELVRRAMVVED